MHMKNAEWRELEFFLGVRKVQNNVEISKPYDYVHFTLLGKKSGPFLNGPTDKM